MTQFIPISLSGNSLGERHRLLNSFVEEAFRSKIPFESIQKLPETTPVDRLFKIDLASKHRDVAYIITNLKDPDMLYVSRALKSTWLLETEHTDVFNPNFLEEQLFPDMTPAAVSKVQYWLLKNLRDPGRCRDFYLYYKDIKFKTAIKFLWHCSNEYILEEFEAIIGKMEPQYLKVLSEKCPQLTKCFYRRLEHDRDVLSNYLGNEKKYFNNLKFILKSDPETFFDVTEKYYNKNKFRSFSADISKYVMFNHKDRFFNKSELYTAWLLNINVIAQYLSTEEIKDLILKLAKAEYLEKWFTYKKVEPLIKKLDKNEQVTFKKYVFVDKAFGEKTKEWPYTPPTAPVLEKIPTHSLFLDHNSTYSQNCRPIECRRGGGYSQYRSCCALKSGKINRRFIERNTLLDRLFDKYRFSSFESTLFELRKRLQAESLLRNREYMLLVLVSKSGGREDSLRTLFELLAKYKNEPGHLRAAIVRSLVTRAFAWRLPTDLWNNLLEWGHGLGLDGNLPEADCNEGLHAVVLRNLLADEMPDPAVLKRFFDVFSHFTEYKLCTEERYCVRIRLPNLLLVATQLNTELKKSRLLDYLLDTLAAYKINFDKFPGVVNAISTAFQEDPKEASFLLTRLYDAHIARKEFFKENFAQIQNDASYVNALRHDISVLDVETFEKVKSSKQEYDVLQFKQFLRKLSVYFSENGGLAERYYALFKLLAETKPNRLLARPLAILAREDFASLLEIFDDTPISQLNSAKRSLAIALRDNIHVSRPLVDLKTLGLRNAGIRAATTFASRSPKNKREELIKDLMTQQRTLTLALTLTDNEDLECMIYKTLVNSKPGAVFKAFMLYLRKKQFGSGFYTIWNTVKPVITRLSFKKLENLQEKLHIMNVPSTIKAEFCIIIYRAHLRMDMKYKTPYLLYCLENILYDVDETFIYEILKDFLECDLIIEKIIKEDDFLYFKSTICIRILGKFLLLCCSEETQKRRLETAGEPFFACLEGLWKEAKCRKDMVQYFESFLLALKYNKVFFDVNYVSCLPVFERVVAWMHSFLPIDKWFVYYSHIHLTMLYYKAARLCVTQQPGYFTGYPSDLDKGVEMFGATFGKLVASAYEELNAKYFNSIRVLYKKDLYDFLCKYILSMKYDESMEKFVIAFVMSILEEVEAKEAHFLACYVFTQQKFKYNFDVKKIENILKENNNEKLRMCYILDKKCSVRKSVPIQREVGGGWRVVELVSVSESESESDSDSESEWD